MPKFQIEIPSSVILEDKQPIVTTRTPGVKSIYFLWKDGVSDILIVKGEADIDIITGLMTLAMNEDL